MGDSLTLLGKRADVAVGGTLIASCRQCWHQANVGIDKRSSFGRPMTQNTLLGDCVVGEHDSMRSGSFDYAK
jgi:hypothetical protein